MRLSLFFVPFRGLEDVLDGLMLQPFHFAFELGQRALGDGLRGFLQDLLDSAQVFAEASERLGKGLVGKSANAVLLHGHGGIEQRAPTRQPVHRFLRLGDMWLHHFADLALDFGDRGAAGFFKGRAHAPVDFVEERFRAPVQLVAVQRQHVVELRAEAVQRILARRVQPRGEVFESRAGFVGLRQQRHQRFGFLAECAGYEFFHGGAQTGGTLRYFVGRLRRRFAGRTQALLRFGRRLHRRAALGCYALLQLIGHARRGLMQRRGVSREALAELPLEVRGKLLIQLAVHVPLQMLFELLLHGARTFFRQLRAQSRRVLFEAALGILARRSHRAGDFAGHGGMQRLRYMRMPMGLRGFQLAAHLFAPARLDRRLRGRVTRDGLVLQHHQPRHRALRHIRGQRLHGVLRFRVRRVQFRQSALALAHRGLQRFALRG